MSKKINSSDPDILGSLSALRRASRRARKLAEMTHTPFYVMQEGRVVNLNLAGRQRKARSKDAN